ncbi:MAG TPA: orotidine 5'-phosphate decarboxylase [Candidatus Bathyarchaeia archaeon]|nr:orotidine 5'-phosphate decarboxylase [Candidatus Bathyarchaeia archaeon]
MFRQEMERSAEKHRSNIVLALDLPSDTPRRLMARSLRILDLTHQHLCALKLNRQAVLPLGLFDGVKEIVERAHDLRLPAIMDAKINDIGNTNLAIAEYYFKAGFDAVIASPFVGWEEGMQPVFEVAQKMKRGVILLVYMSHKGATEGYGQMVQDPNTNQLVPQYRVFAEKALRWKADGAVVGATFPDKIREIHAVLKDRVPIYSPGIGAQGGDAVAAAKAGARYLIVGRAIVDAKDPTKTAERIRDEAWKLEN